MRTVRTDLEVLLEFQVVDHGLAIRALVPKAFRHVFTAVVAAQAGFAEDAHGSGVGCGRFGIVNERQASGGLMARQPPFEISGIFEMGG